MKLLHVALAASLPLFASDPWSRRDLITQYAITATMIVDWGQTLDLTNRDRYPYSGERNPLLGHHPSRAAVNLYFASSILMSWLVMDSIPAKWRPWLQGLSLGIQTGCIANNVSLGFQVRF